MGSPMSYIKKRGAPPLGSPMSHIKKRGAPPLGSPMSYINEYHALRSSYIFRVRFRTPTSKSSNHNTAFKVYSDVIGRVYFEYENKTCARKISDRRPWKWRLKNKLVYIPVMSWIFKIKTSKRRYQRKCARLVSEKMNIHQVRT
jgi:hypothetical protein